MTTTSDAGPTVAAAASRVSNAMARASCLRASGVGAESRDLPRRASLTGTTSPQRTGSPLQIFRTRPFWWTGPDG